jgi:glycosyltransferase involved in cell wall biosynthesis
LKRILIAVIQFAMLPVLALYVALSALGRPRRKRIVSRPNTIALVTPFGAGTKSGSARAERDLLEMLGADFQVRIIALPETPSRSGFIARFAGRLYGSTFPMERRLWDFLIAPNPVFAEVKDANVVFVEFIYAAFFLFRGAGMDYPLVLRDHEVLARRFAIELSNAHRFPDRFVAAARFLSVWLLTFHLYMRADSIVALTPEDAEWLRRGFPFIGERVVAIPVPFRADTLVPTGRVVEPRHLLYAANFYHKPNVDGLVWFLTECAPAIERGVTLHLIGLDEPLKKHFLPETGLTIVRHGHVEDLEGVCSDIPIALAPMISGGGIRIKNLLFGALEKAIVTTSLANEGIGFEHRKEALVCDSPVEFAAAVNALIADPPYARLLGVNARSLVVRKFNHDSIRARYAAEVFATQD